MTDLDNANAERMKAPRLQGWAAFFDTNVYLMLVFLALLLTMSLNACHMPTPPDRPLLLSIFQGGAK